MKTAMQIAVESYKNDGVSFTDWFIDNYQMLLKKEKEQIMKAARVCNFEGMRQGAKTSEEIIKYGEDYYNQTYNQNK